MRTIKLFSITILILWGAVFSQDKPMLSITIDDPAVDSTAQYDWKYKNNAILQTLEKNGIKAALFVCGKRINNVYGRELLEKWNSKGHLICNHSFSHSYFPSSKISLADFQNDFLRCDSIIRKYSTYSRLFRFPYLKEGNTAEKRDGFRDFLSSVKYKMGYVTIDASDWYIDGRIKDTLKVNPKADLSKFKEFYLNHIYSRAEYYQKMAAELTGRNIKHTLLLHHNLLNAMWLGDLIAMFKEKGWDIINADDAYTDEIYDTYPDILPAGESVIWAMAKQSGKYEGKLRYPAEDGPYEEDALNILLYKDKKSVSK